jgi:hypothetical protein
MGGSQGAAAVFAGQAAHSLKHNLATIVAHQAIIGCPPFTSMSKLLSTVTTRLWGLIAFAWMLHSSAYAQTETGADNYEQILGKAGITRSQFLNGALIDKSMSGPIAEAERWYEVAAEQGDPSARGNLAILLYCGDRRPLDVKQAFVHLEALTETGSAPAPWLMGIAYFFGDSIPKDYAKAIPWLELSARRGNPYAVRLLIKIYAEGIGTPKSEEKVIWWLRFAADHGDMPSQIRLAKHLAEAPNGKKNLLASYFWLISAQDEGAFVDKNLVRRVEENIDPKFAADLRLKITKSGPFRWRDWDSESLARAYIFPCDRHLENPVLAQLNF